MTTLITSLIAVGAAVIAIIGALLGARRSGAKDQANANRAKEADAYEKHLQEIADAAAARNAVDPRIVPDNDSYRRD